MIGGPFGAAVIRRRFGLSAQQAEEDEVEGRRVAQLAVDRLAGRPFVVGDGSRWPTSRSPRCPRHCRSRQASAMTPRWPSCWSGPHDFEDEFTPPRSARPSSLTAMRPSRADRRTMNP